MRQIRHDVFLDINSFTKKHQNREESCTDVKLPVQDSSLFWCFFVNEFMCMKTSRLVHRKYLSLKSLDRMFIIILISIEFAHHDHIQMFHYSNSVFHSLFYLRLTLLIMTIFRFFIRQLNINSAICLAMDDVCNGVKDCPLGDDEYFCDMFHIKCPGKCFCLLFVIES